MVHLCKGVLCSHEIESGLYILFLSSSGYIIMSRYLDFASKWYGEWRGKVEGFRQNKIVYKLIVVEDGWWVLEDSLYYYAILFIFEIFLKEKAKHNR